MYIPNLHLRDTVPDVTPVYTGITPLTAGAIAAGIAADLFLTALVIWLCVRHRRRRKAIDRQRERMAEKVATHRRASRWLSGVLLLGRRPSQLRHERDQQAAADGAEGTGSEGLKGIKEEKDEDGFEEVDLKHEKTLVIQTVELKPEITHPKPTWNYSRPREPTSASTSTPTSDSRSVKSFKSTTNKSFRELKYEAKEAKLSVRPLNEIGRPTSAEAQRRSRSRSRSRSTKATAVQIVSRTDRDLDWGAMLGAPLTPRTPRQMVRAWEEYGESAVEEKGLGEARSSR